MSVDLLSLISKFRSSDDRETQAAWFRTLVPWVAPEAYLNIVFKGTVPALLDPVARKWQFPMTVVDVLQQHNGAMLFSGALNLYGVVEPGRLLNRQDRFSLPPFNIERENNTWRVDPRRLLVIGGYKLDGSRVCVDRSDSHVYVFKKGQQTPTATWRCVEDWLIDEVDRLAALFDEEGKRIGPETGTGPPEGVNSNER